MKIKKNQNNSIDTDDNKKNKDNTILPNIIRSKTKHNDENSSNKNKIINDIQKQQQNIINPLLKNKDDWLTPDIQNQIENNKILSKGIKNPKFIYALQLLQDNPKKAMKKFQDSNNTDIIEYLNEFCKVMGNHFSTIGGGSNDNINSNDNNNDGNTMKKQEKLIEEIDNDRKKIEKKEIIDSTTIGPLAMNAWEKNNSSFSLPPTPISKKEQKMIDTIVSNKELSNLLMDVDLQTQIQQCGKYPGKLQNMMRHPNYGPKIRKLIDAGLLQVVR